MSLSKKQARNEQMYKERKEEAIITMLAVSSITWKDIRDEEIAKRVINQLYNKRLIKGVNLPHRAIDMLSASNRKKYYWHRNNPDSGKTKQV
jgi:hypothetical protein